MPDASPDALRRRGPCKRPKAGPWLGAPLALIAVAGLMTVPGLAQDKPADSTGSSLEEERAKANALERAIEDSRRKALRLGRAADDLAGQIETLRAQSIEAARNAQDHETRLSDLESQLETLEQRRDAKATDLKARHTQLGATLAALQRIAVRPVDALIVAPGTPIDTVRGATLLGAAIPALEDRADLLRAELTELAALSDEISLRRGEVADTVKALAGERAHLKDVIKRKGETWAVIAAEQRAMQRRASRMATEAKTLRELIQMVEREAQRRAELEREVQRQEAEAREAAAREAEARAARETAETDDAVPRVAAPAVPSVPAPDAESEKPAAPATTRAIPQNQQVALARPPNIRPFPASPASLVMPARGRIVLRYGQPHGNDSVSRGVVVAARDGAQVVAPYDGKVVYAGPFRRYGQILIIEHGERYHTLLAGLDRIDAVVGQWLLAGEPVGMLVSTEDSASELYIELRRAGQPINPLPWLATTGDKVRG